MHSRLIIAGIGWLFAVGAVARADDAAPISPADEAVVAEVQATKAEFPPSGPVSLRFVLWNRSTGVVEIPYHGPLVDDLTLPLDVVLGGADSPSLFVSREGDVFETVLPDSTPREDHVLRIAPKSGVGVELDLLTLSRSFRITGAYQLEWRPLGGKLATASARFRVELRKQAVLVTDFGKITFNLEYDKAPRNVENFMELARSGAYTNKTIHRVIAGDLLQGGDPKGDGTGIRPDGKTVPAEFHGAPFTLGTLAMARKAGDPNSASCQFLITLSRSPELDGQYTIIGQATDDESYRTLRQLSTTKTDKKYRPIKPLVIRSVSLVDAPQESPTERVINLTTQPAGK